MALHWRQNTQEMWGAHAAVKQPGNKLTWKSGVTKEEYSMADSCLCLNKAYQDHKANAPDLHGSYYIAKV